MPINPADRLLSDDDLAKLFGEPPQIPERSALAFMYDEGVNQQGIDFLRGELRLYVTSVQEQGLAGEESDLRVLAHARRIGCALVTQDKGFISHHWRLHDMGLNHAGIIFVRISRSTTEVMEWIQATYQRSVELEAPSYLHYLLWQV